ncbi:MAG: hypothetical protein HDS08_04710 [Bacteroides sp.]|nr:hypothetical protein [Bacteroides sp.]
MTRLYAYLRAHSLWGIIISIVAIAAIAVIYFYPDALQGNVLRQYDTQQGIAIGQEAKAFTEATGETTRWTNSVFSGMPTFQIAPSYPSSRLFTWINSLMGLGLPSPSNLLAMMMIGFFILGLAMRMRWYVALIGAIAYGFSSYFIIIIGAGHIWKFVTLAYIPPTIAGIVLAYRGRYMAGAALAALSAMMQISSNHPQMSYYFLFVIVGFVIAYLISAIRNGRLRQWGIATGLLAVAAVLAVAANSPSLYNTYEYSKETIRGGHSELSRPDGQAPSSSAGLDRDYITQYSYGTSETFTLLIPNVKGGASVKPEKGSMKMLNLASLDDAQDMAKAGQADRMTMTYLEYMSQYFGEPESTNGPVYVGALIVALFLLGCIIVRGPLKWVLVVLTALSLLLALGRNFMWLTDLMIDYMPMYAKFRTVESILVIAEFTMPLLAVMALQQLLTNKNIDEAWQQYRRPLYWSFGIVLALCLIAMVMPSFYGNAITEADRNIDAMIAQGLAQQGVDARTAMQLSLSNPSIYSAVESLRYSMVRADGLRSLIIVAAGLVILLLYFRRRVSAAVMVAGVGIVVAADLITVNKRYLDHDSFVARNLATGDPFPMTQTDRVILSDTTSHYRVMNLPQFWQPDPSYRHKTIGGYHAAKLTRYQDLIDRHLGNFLTNNPSEADWNVLNMLNARYIVDYQGQPLFNNEAYGNAWMVDTVAYVNGADSEMAGLDLYDPRRVAVADETFRHILGEASPADSTDAIRLTSYRPNRLTYHADSRQGGIAVFSEVYFPWGWNATIDGTPAEIARVDYVLRALRIPAGSHTVEMTFDPESLHVTDTLATVSVILIYLLVALAIGSFVVKARRQE